ncbi:MAG: class I SAM-dependent methyltransferase [Kiritimatiellia bacterium]
MQPAPLNSNQWHAAIVGNLSVRQVVENVVNENNAWFPAVLAATAPGDSLLELGCGTGVFSGILAKKGRRTTLLDYSAESVEFCRKVFAQAGLPGNFVQADVCRTLPFADDAFDCTWSSGLLEHFTDEQLLFILKESARVSRRCVVSLVPNARSIFYRLGKWYQEQHGLWAWGKEDPKRTMKSFFEAAGLVDVREFTIDVKTAIAFVHPIRAKMLRKSLLLLSRLLPEAGWRFLNQGYLLVTIGQKPETIRHHRDGGGRKLDFSDGIGIVT